MVLLLRLSEDHYSRHLKGKPQAKTGKFLEKLNVYGEYSPRRRLAVGPYALGMSELRRLFGIRNSPTPQNSDFRTQRSV